MASPSPLPPVARARFIHAVEAFGQARQMLLADAGPVVAHFKFGALFGAQPADVDARAIRRGSPRYTPD